MALLAPSPIGIDTMLAQADKALYLAKHGGRDRCVVADALQDDAAESMVPFHG